MSHVTDMNRTFDHAKFSDNDISRWNVSSIKDMYMMFWGATFFKRKLCGGAWVHSQARKTVMFVDTSGSILSKVCVITMHTDPPVFSPGSRSDLKSAVDVYLEPCAQDDPSGGSYGSIEEWDVICVFSFLSALWSVTRR